MVAMLIYAGLRREELLWLTAQDVHLQNRPSGLIHVRAKTIDAESWQPKTNKNPSVPVSSDLRPYLDSHARRPSSGEWYFPSPQRRRWDLDNFSATLRSANARLHLPWTCLDFRHTFGSQLAQNAASLYQLSSLMDHSPEICRKHYAALSTTSLVPCVEFLPSRTISC